MVRFLVLVLLSFHIIVFGQSVSNGTIKGRLIDSESRYPLIGANIILKNTPSGASTNENGEFEIQNVSPGTYALVFSYIGYEQMVKTDIIVRPGRITFVEAELKPVSLNMSDVVVRASYFSEIEEQPLSAVTFSSEEIRRSPGSAGDVSRIVMNLPSLAKVNDTRNSLIVRGGSPVENAFYLDNIEIPNINHYAVQGSSDGPIGLINVDFIKDVNFYSGGFNSSYGDRLSSIMELSFREGNRDEFDMQLDMSIQSIGGSFEGPLGNNGSWLFSARRSYFDILFKLVDINGPKPTYSDYQGKIVYNLSDKLKLSLLNILAVDYSYQSRDEGYDFESNNFGGLDNINNTGGVNLQYLWNRNGFSNLSIAHTYMHYKNTVAETRTGSDILYNKSTEQEIKIRNNNHFTMGTSHKIDFGVDGKFLINDYSSHYFPYTDRLGNTAPELIINDNFNSFKAGAFVNYTWNPIEQLTFLPGARLDYFNYNENLNVSPRFTLMYNLNRITTLSATAGVYYQNLPLVLLGQNEQFKDLKDPMAYHYILSFSRLLTENTKLTIEAYDKEYSNFPMNPDQPQLFILDQVYSDTYFSGYDKLIDYGKARSYGIEFILQKKLADKIYGMLSASYFRAKYQDLTGKWQNRTYDNRVTFAAEGGYKPDEKWEFSLRWMFAGGAPYTPFNEAASAAAFKGIYDLNSINTSRLPDYHSLNLRVDRRFLFSGSNLIFYLSIWNTYGRENLITYTWDELKNKPRAEKAWSILPVFGLEYEL